MDAPGEREGKLIGVRVLREYRNEQLQDPELALSDSSVLTCLLLSSFEVSRWSIELCGCAPFWGGH